MKTNELKCADLRIGNYVNIEGDVVKVKEIYEKSIHYANGEYESYATEDFIHPIELTEELMLNIGFKKVFQSKITKGRFELNVDMGDNEFLNIVYHVYASGNTNLNITQRRCASLCDDSIDKSGIKYLHQLQNTYYLLTNEEMEVKL